MRSTFMGLEASKKGLFVQQSALYTTGHNISNANAEGYSRQRVNMQATPGYPHPGLNSPTYPGHLGTGVEASSVQRIRDEFIDRQYRQETNKLGYWDSTLKSINQMEDILTEPSEFGINQAFTDFWKSFQDVSKDPDDAAARKVAIAKAESLADAFNYNYTQLETIQGNLGNEIAVSAREINTILKKIAAINEQVQALEPNGYVTNDLYDARDLLVDELNEYLPVSIERVPSGGRASEVAEGTLTIKYQGIVLVEGKHAGTIEIKHANGQINSVASSNGKYELFESLEIKAANAPGSTKNGDKNFNYADMETAHASRGRLLALIDAYGHTTPDRNLSNGIYPDMMKELDNVAAAFVKAFNDLHKQGFTLKSNTVASAQGGEFFNPTGNTAKTISVVQDVINQPNLIAASTRIDEEGNGAHATILSNLQFGPNNDLSGFTFQDYYKGMIGDLAVQGAEAKNMQYNSQTQMITVSNARASMSSVSLDEEMTNMITFQQAYNANARMITVVDETLDKIINGMGRVGL